MSLTPRQKLEGVGTGFAADRFRQSLQQAADRLQSSVVRRVTPSQPTTPTTPGANFDGGHPLAMFGSNTNIPPPAAPQTPTSAGPVTPSARRDVPPSPGNESIRGSKTLMRLNKALDQRDKNQPTASPARAARPTSLIQYSDNENHSDASKPPKTSGTSNSKSGTPDRTRKLVLGSQLPGVHNNTQPSTTTSSSADSRSVNNTSHHVNTRIGLLRLI